MHCEAAEEPWSGGCIHPLGIWGQNFSLPCSARRRAREGTRSTTCSQCGEHSQFLSYLQNASKGEREGVMGPSQTGNVHQLLLSELSLEAAGEESRYGRLQLGQSSSGCWALHSGALLICMFLSTTAMKFINHAEGDSPVSQRPLVTGCTSQQYVERSKTASQQTITSRKSCTQQSSGLYALRFALFYSYQVSVGSRGHFMASSMLVTVHSPLLFSRCKQTIQNPDPK